MSGGVFKQKYLAKCYQEIILCLICKDYPQPKGKWRCKILLYCIDNDSDDYDFNF